ncbi:AbrB/MazE/SpoVT family DNA-binding domain-containing protein [Desulfotomaculum copahuensis]|uniref:SpoVT-AbrB domain-containing protein n=1 Tax=Desulfotomaculum copahuensis TaxID=1838280 RepID=A0A1B7LBA9_9FIRM|nr:AbrB/MazE/SpoVT family DNA-binding domain-containing protein [Desulfotomaculum copahuensis]OAT79815.1 hypothetical protein A6M21_15320 [Desulfotomaculum copahuensis]
MAIVKISSKRQITLPARLCRALNLKEGDRLALEIKGDQITFTRVPDNITHFFSGIARGVYGATSRQVDEYVREERDSWE